MSKQSMNFIRTVTPIARRSGVWGAWFLVACAVHTVAAPAVAVGLGDAASGQAYAKKSCARCHAIKAGQKTSNVAEATPFEIIANTPGINRAALIVFFRNSHPTMPNMIVDDEDVDNVIAYIMNLKDKP